MSTIWSRLINLAGNITGTLGIANGGTGATTKAAAFDALSPMSAAGDVIYGGTAGTGTRLVAGTSTTVLHGGTVPSWSQIVDADVSAGAAIAGSKITAAGTNTPGTLSWYEESTFTPTLSAATPGSMSPTYSVQEGSFTRIGRTVHYTLYISLSNFSQGTGSGALRVLGLPYASSASPTNAGWLAPAQITNALTTSATVTSLAGIVIPGQSYLQLRQQTLSSVTTSSTATPNFSVDGVATTFVVTITGWYNT